jgi:hypothetical protein
MPIFQTGVTPAAAGTTITTAAGYAALLAAMSAASDGDLGEDTDTGVHYYYYKPAGGPGILVPTAMYDRCAAYSSDATGDAFFTIADDEDTDSDLTNRGFVISETNSGTATKAADGALILTAPSTNDVAKLEFTPTTATAKGLVIMRVEWKVSTDAGDNIFYASGPGGYWTRLTFSAGTGGYTRMYTSSGAALVADTGEIDLSGAEWLFYEYDYSGDQTWTSVTTEESDMARRVACTRSKLHTGAAEKLLMQIQNGATLELSDLHWIELT